MTVHEDLPILYHQQDTDYFCGAACAQTILDQCGSGLLDQADLYNDSHGHSVTEAGWYTAPDGLTWTLNDRQPTRYFALDALTTEDAISRKVVWTIHNSRLPAVALVRGDLHWLVVRGYTATAAPTGSQDVGYTISGFDVNDPFPAVSRTAPPPPHGTGDNCGGGGSLGVADEHLSYTAWRRDYMTGVPGGYWGGRFVAVGDPAPPPARHPQNQNSARPEFDGARLLPADRAASLAMRALQQQGLTDRPAWKAALEGTSDGEPVLVQRLDRADSFYWIVPRVRNGLAVVATIIDGRDGEYLQARMLREPRESVLLLLTRAEIEERISGTRHRLPGREGELFVRPGLATIGENWVWRPCRESLSPFYPFKLVTYGAHRLYVRSDGEVFTSLTTSERGL